MKHNTTLILFTLILSYSLAQYPGDVSQNLNLWYKANKNVINASNNSALHNNEVEVWQDNSSYSNDALQSNTNYRPKFKHNASQNINYNPYIYFRKNDSTHLLMNQNDLPVNGDSRTITIVAQPTGSPNNQSLIYFGDSKLSNNGDFVALNLKKNNTYRLHFGNHVIHANQNNIKPGIYTLYLPSITNPMTNDFQMRKDGQEQSEQHLSGSSHQVTTDNNFASIGAGIFNSNNPLAAPKKYWNGNVGELCIYNTDLSNIEMLKIESYLAIKYGVSLLNNYINSSGNIVWNRSNYNSYNNDIIGIARDDNSDLLQKQSKSYTNSHIIFIDDLKDLNTNNNGSFSVDRSFAIVGHNNDNICPTIASNIEKPGIISDRIAREFKIHKSNFNQNISINIDICNTFLSTLNDLKILIDSDGDFTNAAVYNNGDLGMSLNISGTLLSIENIPSSIIANNAVNFLTIGRVSQLSLPIELVYFNAKRQEKDVLLTWQTASEINNDFFTVERSEDAKNWTQIATIKGTGNTNELTNYSYLDKDISKQKIYYYQLKQTDFDGQFSYSQIKVIDKKSKNNQTILVYPNPSFDYIKIDLEKAEFQKIKIISTNGKELFNEKITQNSTTIDITNFTKGLYYIYLKSDEKQKIIKFLKN